LEPLFAAWISKDTSLIRKELARLFMEGYAGLQILSQIHEEVVSGSLFDKKEKSSIAVMLGKTEKRLCDGADEELQLLSLLTCLS